MIGIAGLRALSDRLARLDMSRTQQETLQNSARDLRDAVQERLSTPPGGDHSSPWRKTGALQQSIGYQANETGAVIGSDDPAAVAQELGTRNFPPRPFLSTTAAAQAPEIAHQVANAVTNALRAAMKGTMS